MNNTTAVRLTMMIIALLLLWTAPLRAQDESIIVRTHTYGSPPEGKFLFPPDTMRFEKILMHYKLRCPFDAQCGEWDYLMYIYLYDHTGKIDSTRDTATSFRVGDAAPDSLPYMLGPSWRYFPRIVTSVTRTATTSFDSSAIGDGTETVSLEGGSRSGRLQFLWRRSELLAAGLEQENITGIRFQVQTPGSMLRNLTVRMKNATRDSLTGAFYENTGLVTVYSRDTRFDAAGWAKIDFPVPFAWDGTSSIVVDISYDGNAPGGTSTTLAAASASFSAGIAAHGDDRALRFEGADHIDVPAGALAGIDSAVTISFWQYGDTARQPQNNSILEGVDQFGRRVLNIHLPWSDGTVYWDAGMLYGSYDRLSKAAQPANYEGGWNHWVFTKNVRTGSMRIYLNGVPWASVGSKKKPMSGITTFRIGSFANGSYNYDGSIDELAIWNVELPADTIRRWGGNRDIGASGPYRSSLRLYYKFNDDALMTVADSSGNGFTGALAGLPGRSPVAGDQIFRTFTASRLRPNVIFEQGVYTSSFDTTVQVDSLPSDPMQVFLFDNTADPSKPTDTLTVWPAYYRYNYNKLGVVTDSTRVIPDSVLRLVKIPYFRKFEVIDRYEIGRYITPYGNGLNLGEGFTWTFDVSDYRTLLHDSVHIAAYNQQELVDMTFELVRGTPPRDPIDIRNLWTGGFPYGTGTSIETFLSPRRVKIPENAANTRVKMRATGHGFGGNENCAEFCPKVHSILVNGTSRYDTTVWKDDCGLNPVYPQGGTWVYNRTNWCPGDDVPTYDLELTPFVTPGDSVTLDYNVESYTWNGAGSTPYYQVETQLVSYSAPNFTLDAAIDAIKSPSTTDVYRRMNPICGHPVITIKNTGSTPLTSLTINYGVTGGTPAVYNWTGNLGFLESEDVTLGDFSWSGASREFYATVSAPNGGEDQYARNNTLRTSYTAPPEYPSSVIFELKTNNNPWENWYEIKDMNGNVVHSRRDMEADVTYRDTLTLPTGCYELRLVDEGNDGLQWWANAPQGAGYLRVRNGGNNQAIKTFGADFGAEIYQQFTVGYNLSGVDAAPERGEGEDHLDIYPNPTTGEFTIDLRLAREQEVSIAVRDLLGREIYTAPARRLATGRINLDLSGAPAGIYIVNVQTAWGVMSRKVVKE